MCEQCKILVKENSRLLNELKRMFRLKEVQRYQAMVNHSEYCKAVGIDVVSPPRENIIPAKEVYHVD